jgi:hypothetical protein
MPASSDSDKPSGEASEDQPDVASTTEADVPQALAGAPQPGVAEPFPHFTGVGSASVERASPSPHFVGTAPPSPERLQWLRRLLGIGGRNKQ